MQSSELARGVAAARTIASALGLDVNDVVVLQNSNKLALRLGPCGVFARVAPLAHQDLGFEIELAQRLAETQSPVAALEPRVEPRVYERDGFAVTLWTYYESLTPLGAAAYAAALAQLHSGMRKLKVASPHFTDRVIEAQNLVASHDLTPELPAADRRLLFEALRGLSQAVGKRAAPEQLVHGEPHPGNLLMTNKGPLFIDLETCCRAPVEFDLAHVPEAVSALYPGVDTELLGDFRGLVLAMVAAWRWDRADEFPNGRSAGQDLLHAVREGPPWPTLDVLMSAAPGR